ncbi:MAG: phenylacetate--CoA ligase family protein [Candidatus Zixiibacteriota bacterium]
MDLIKYLSATVFTPLYDLKEGRRVGRELKHLYKSQHWSAERIRDRQLAQLREMIDYAVAHSAFYRRAYGSAGVGATDITSLSDISKFPVLTKDDIRANLNDMVSDEYPPATLFAKRTGGSTGVPLRLYVDKEAMTLKLAATRRHNSWANYRTGDKLAAIWGDTDKKYSWKERLLNSLIYRTIYLDTLKLDEAYMLDFVARVKRFKPSVLMGHAHSLYVFSLFAEENGISDLPFQSIISTSEVLYDSERAKIEEVFGPIVFDRYGCEELSIVASECEKHEGLHINADGLYVEVIGGDEVNPGKLVITDLWNYGMPLIRYEVGDMATTIPAPCPCGRGLPRLGKVYGRTSDFLITPEGKMISGISILDTFTIHVPGVKQVQIVQDQIDELVFKVVKGPNFGDISIQTISEKVPTFFGRRMRHKIEIVETIPQTARGKYRFSICNVPLRGNRGN